MSDPRPLLTLAHSPDPDDAFMWWPLIELDGDAPAVQSDRFRFQTVTEDIESLNQRAEERADLDITAISCAQYARVCSDYAITACGASVGDGYGPKIVARNPITIEEMRASAPRVASPGVRTTAHTAFSLLMQAQPFEVHAVPFKDVPEIVARGDADIGIVIHEGQLTFEQQGLSLVADLGAWWKQEHGTLLPLGLNVVATRLADAHGDDALPHIAEVLEASIRHAMAHKDRSVAYAMDFAGDMEVELAESFIDLYVNRWTLAFGEEGEAAVTTFLEAAAEAGVVPDARPVRFVRPADQPSGAAKMLGD